jgi:Leucine-rich repeat (LRR) protein
LSGLQNLTTIYLYNTKVRGPGLVHLSALPNLQYLELSHTPLEDVGLEHLGRMQGLKSLGLAHTKITDAGVPHLAELKNLENLSLNYTDVTDESLVHLQRLSKLKELELKGARISSEGAQRISQTLPNCKVLVIYGLGQEPTDVALFPVGHQPSADEINAKFKELGIDGQVWADPSQPDKPIVQLFLGQTTLSDAAVLKLISVMPLLDSITVRGALVGNEFVEGIGQLVDLRYLEMKETRLTDDGLRHLSCLSGLRELVIEQAEITDEGVPFLAGLKQLRLLQLRDVRISEDGFERLRQALPNCGISR